jgi:hypothetical protein
MGWEESLHFSSIFLVDFLKAAPCRINHGTYGIRIPSVDTPVATSPRILACEVWRFPSCKGEVIVLGVMGHGSWDLCFLPIFFGEDEDHQLFSVKKGFKGSKTHSILSLFHEYIDQSHIAILGFEGGPGCRSELGSNPDSHWTQQEFAAELASCAVWCSLHGSAWPTLWGGQRGSSLVSDVFSLT